MSQALVERIGPEKLPFGQADKRLHELLDLSGKVAVVTGGGGQNIGRACVNKLAGSGARIMAADLDGAAAETIAREVSAKWNVECAAQAADFTRWEDVSAVAQSTRARFGRIDIWVNCVGNPSSAGPFHEQDPATIKADIERNLLSAMLGARAALDVMIPQGSGRIINIASEGGRIASPLIVAYSGAKAGVIGFTRSLAADLAGTGVTAACVSPGFMVSPKLVEVLAQVPADLEQSIDYGIDRTIAGRVGVAEEIGNMVAYLCSEAGAFIIGNTVSVGGGMGE